MIKRAFLILLCLIFMIFHADLVTKGAVSGLLLWYSSVVPALFPFMVLSSVLSASGGVQALMRPFPVIFRFAGLSADGWYVLLTGLLCGCPMGAKTCADLYAEGRISSGEAKFLFALCNHPSPMFLAGFVCPMFASQVPLSYFVFSIYAPLLLLAVPASLIYRREHVRASFPASFTARAQTKHSAITLNAAIMTPDDPSVNRLTRPTIALNAAIMNPDAPSVSRLTRPTITFDAAIINSAEILVKIGGYLIFYSILILVVRNTPRIPAPVRLFLCGSLEITTGIRTVHGSLPYPVSAVAAAAIFSFGGFSALSQTNAVIQSEKSHQNFPADKEESSPVHGNFPLNNKRIKKTAGLSIRQYLLWKIAHAALAAAFMAVLTGILGFHFF